MILSKISLMVGICLTILMIVFHISFPKLFKWKKDFQRITGTNKRIFFTIHIALFLFFIMIATLSIFHFNELVKCTGISFSFLLSLSIFWLWRTIWQVVYFKPEKGSSLLYMHYLLTLIFFLLFISYSIPIIVTILKI